MGDSGAVRRIGDSVAPSGLDETQLVRAAAQEIAGARSLNSLATVATRFVLRAFRGRPAQVRVVVASTVSERHAVPSPAQGDGEIREASGDQAFGSVLWGSSEGEARFPIEANGEPIGALEVRGDSQSLQHCKSFLETLASLLAPAVAAHAVVRTFPDPAKRQALGVAVIAHELKNPLAAVRASLEYILESGEQVAAGGHALLIRSRRQLERMSRMIDAVTEWVQHPHSSTREQIDLAALVREAAVAAQLSAARAAASRASTTPRRMLAS